MPTAAPPAPAAPQRHVLPEGGLEQGAAEAAKAAAPTVAAYNRESGGTQGIVPGMAAHDLHAIREAAKANPRVAANWGQLTDPTQWVVGAVQGAKAVKTGVGQVAAGHTGAGLLSIGGGSLAMAAVLPIGRVGALVGALGKDADAFAAAAEMARNANTSAEAVHAVHAANIARSSALASAREDMRFLKPDGTVSKWGLKRVTTIDRAHEAIVVHAHSRVPEALTPPTEQPEVPGAYHGYSLERVGKNLKAKLNLRTQTSGLPPDATVLTPEGIHAYGHITPEQWVQRVVKTLPDLESRDASARWYESFEPLFVKHFGPDVADKIMRAFSVSQANASPVGGLASTLVAHERLQAGEDVGSIGSVVADNIEKALKGEHIDSHVAAKLSDFIDALRGSSTRTWMGHDVRGGAPAPIDIWGQRDLGHVDSKLLSKGLPERVLKEHGVDIRKATLTPAGAAGARYERLAEKYHEITDHLNATNFDGRSDWTPAQVQALGWHAIQKFYGRNPESLEEAILKGPARAQAMIGRHKALLRNPHLRVGGWHNPDDGQVYLDISRVLPTREEAMAFAREHGQLSILDRAALHREDWENAFPKSGLSEQEADAIKTAARHKAQAPATYDGILIKYARQHFRPTGAITPLDRKYAEEAIHAWADARPNEPIAQQFKKLYADAHEVKSSETPEPEDVFGPTVAAQAEPASGPHETAAAALDAFANELEANPYGKSIVFKDAHTKATALDVGEARHAAEIVRRDAAAGVPYAETVEKIPGWLRDVALKEPLFRLPRMPWSRAASVAGPVAHSAAGALAAHALHAPHMAGDMSMLAGAIPRAVDRPGWLGGGLEHRTPEEAAAHLAPLMEQAKAEGWGNHVGSKDHPPIVEEGVSTPETGGLLGKSVREALPHAPAIRDVQKGNMSAERAERVRAAEQASERAGGGTPGHFAAKAELKGSFGREAFQHLKHLTPDDVHTLNQLIDEAPLQFFEKTTAKDALLNAVEDGVAPTAGEQTLLERVFGVVADGEGATEGRSLGDKLVQGLNVPRALRSSADISAPFRQNLITAVTHPVIFSRNFAKMLKQFGSEAYYQASVDAIHSDPLYPLLQKWSNGKLFSEIGDTAKEGASVVKREEAMVGANVAERLNLRELPGPWKGKRFASGPGDVVRASDRAFTGVLNNTRMELARNLVEKAALMGHDLSKPNVGESITRFIGTATGRGVVPKVLEDHLLSLNVLLFSPRLMASRLNMMSPVYYKKLDPFARGEAVAAARNLVAALGTVMVIAKMGGAEVGFDPRSSNFGKIKVGDTRVDITGGFNQYVRTIAQEMSREVITSAGTHEHITTPFVEKAGAPGTTTDLENMTKVFRSKSAPIPGTIWDVFSGKNFIGQPVTAQGELGQNTPFLAQDVYDAKKVGATPKRLMVAAFLSAIGFGVQSYKEKPPAGGSGSIYGGGGDSSNIYGGGGSSSIYGP
jgi:hypothetical protein